jgi:hypothetical protein
MSTSKITYNPFVSIVETYETSEDLPYTSELLKMPEADFAETDTRNLVLEFKNTQWTSLRRADADFPLPEDIVHYPVTDEALDVYSNLLESTTKELKVFNLNHFRS